MRLLRSRENLVAANPEPFDMRLAGLDLGAVAEGGTAIARVGNLPDVPCALHPLDAQRAGWLAPLLESVDQLANRLPERAVLLTRETGELAGEARRDSKVGLINQPAVKMPR